MRERRDARTTVAAIVLATALAGLPQTARADLPQPVKDQLASSKYVYIASTRKGGSLSKPAEIWYLYRDGAVYVGTLPTSWRARRIKAGRPTAKIWVGSQTGPSFNATGAIVKDPQVEQAMFAAYAKKYAEGWSSFEEKFRAGFKDGSRVLIKYTPVD